MRLLTLAPLSLLAAGSLGAQQVPTTLSLTDAIGLARKNNPTYLQTVNAERRAGNAVRNAYGAFLPSVNSSLGAGYRQGKPQNFAGIAIGSNSDLLSSSWGLNLNLGISANTFANLRRNQQNEDAATADTRAAEQNLVSTVTQQYLLAMQTAARAALQDSLVVSNQLQLELAQAKAGVGSATSLDVMRAEVAVGQQRVGALRARNTADVAMLQLFQQIGVPRPDSVTLTSTFAVEEPAMTVSSLLEMASQSNPTLAALKRREDVAHTSYRAAQGAYLPSFSASASFGGFAQQYRDADYLVNQAAGQAFASRASCFTTDSLRTGAGLPSIAAQCANIRFTDAQANALRSSNSAFPFRFTSNPYNFSVGLSLPLFDGLSRETQVEDAAANRMDARYRVRAQELTLTANVTSAWTTLVANFRAFRLQEQNAAAARAALELAQERYRVGLNSLVDLQQARGDFATAETDRIDALYEFHRSFAALENAVGRSLR